MDGGVGFALWCASHFSERVRRDGADRRPASDQHVLLVGGDLIDLDATGARRERGRDERGAQVHGRTESTAPRV